jgi:hypothetical protein
VINGKYMPLRNAARGNSIKHLQEERQAEEIVRQR